MRLVISVTSLTDTHNFEMERNFRITTEAGLLRCASIMTFICKRSAYLWTLIFGAMFILCNLTYN